MARRSNVIAFDGKLYINPNNNELIIEEIDKKTKESTYYNITKEIREAFEGKTVTISINEKSDAIEPVEDPFTEE
jgi:hypothetical protein